MTSVCTQSIYQSLFTPLLAVSVTRLARVDLLLTVFNTLFDPHPLFTSVNPHGHGSLTQRPQALMELLRYDWSTTGDAVGYLEPTRQRSGRRRQDG